MITNKDREIFVEALSKDFSSKISGSEIERLVGNTPDNAFMVGKLNTADGKSEISSKVNVTQMELDFYVPLDGFDELNMNIIPKGEFYYRVLPTLQEQQQIYMEKIKEIYEGDKIIDSFDDIKGIIDSELFTKDTLRSLDKCPLEKSYQKMILDDSSFMVRINAKDIDFGKTKYATLEYDEVLTKIIDRKVGEIWDKKNAIKDIRDTIKLENIRDELSYQDFIDQHQNSEVPRPLWGIRLVIKFKKIDCMKIRVSVSIINSSKEFEGNIRKDKAPYSNTLFNAGLKVELSGSHPLKIESNYFKDNYKYDSDQYAIATNTSYEYMFDLNTFETINIPSFRQNKLKTKNNIKVKFAELVTDPIETLMNVYREMENEVLRLNKLYDFKKDNLVKDRDKLKQAQRQFEDEVDHFKSEVRRFHNGINYLKTKDFVLKAFKSMNESFMNTAKGYDSWRLFQIVFIVSMIPDIIVSEYGLEEIDNSKIDEVDLLYFPTGGGKTEAFLGITVFTLFFDRIRGKESGISAIIKYPLRLLSIQQVDRLAVILATAEKVRCKEYDTYPGERFSIGYFVGDRNTPNKIAKKDIEFMLSRNQKSLDEDYRIIDICPFCRRETIHISYDENSHRLKHVCTTEDCSSNGELPIYIVDSEIYRYLPSVLVSTIDKIASIGNQSNFRNLIGEVTHKCPLHGYTSKTKCTENEVCKDEVNDFIEVNIKDPAPSLLIQDEVHLIRESLGTFDAHYETLFQYFIEELVSTTKKLKIIGATATVSKYETQINHLYFKGATRFPCEVPSVNENFYSWTDSDELNRIIIGYAPYGKAIINAVVYSMKYLREVVFDYLQNPEKILLLDKISFKDIETARKMVEDYWIFLQYNNVKYDSNKVLSAIDSPINNELQTIGVPVFEPRKMTGDDSFQDVRKILKEIETTENVFEGMNLISATSMISHGVDARKFNIMFFFGMPGNTAEYIQAYSRVGREFPGLVINIFRPTRERDNSYLKNFNGFHEYKDILVEQVPINRWASRAVEKTFPGILSAILLNYYDKKLQYDYTNIYNTKVLKGILSNGIIDKKELGRHIKEAYRCFDSDLAIGYERYIDKKIEDFYRAIEDYSFGDNYHYIAMDLKKLGIGISSPMNSLRDSSKNVKIELE